MARENSLNYDLNRLSLSGGGEHAHKANLSDLTVRSYKASNAKFADFCKEELGVKTYSQLQHYGKAGAIKKYIEHLQNDGKTSQTIHTYIAPICKACNISMNDIDHPRRISADIVRGRTETARSASERLKPEYGRSVALNEALGLRVNELRHLRGCDLVERDGSLYVHVERGKGGKEQLQLVLPEHIDTVRSVFDGVRADELVLKKNEVSKNINYHGMRANVAKEAYAYHAERLQDPAERQAQREHLIDLYKERHIKPDRADAKAYKRYENGLRRFEHNVNNDSVYVLRGDNAKLAISKGLPCQYDRLALLTVSIEHLSHWDNHTTIGNYLLA